jgi:CCR4-NOT transcriptional regulation complex NOT5 subunit
VKGDLSKGNNTTSAEICTHKQQQENKTQSKATQRNLATRQQTLDTIRGTNMMNI